MNEPSVRQEQDEYARSMMMRERQGSRTRIRRRTWADPPDDPYLGEMEPSRADRFGITEDDFREAGI